MKMMRLLGSVFVRLIRMLRFRSCLNMNELKELEYSYTKDDIDNDEVEELFEDDKSLRTNVNH